MGEAIKSFFERNTSYIIVIGITTALNTLFVSLRSNDRIDFNTLLVAYEKENSDLRHTNKTLLTRISVLESNVAILNSEIMMLMNDSNECDFNH